MPDAANDIKARRFRRAALAGAAITLAFFLWTIWMMVHFNNGPASVRFGGKTMLNIASIALPSPALLGFLAWNARMLFCRVVGWASLPLALLLNGTVVAFATVQLRPPFAPGDYDAAVNEAEAQLHGLVSTEAGEEFRQIRSAFKSHPAAKEDHARLLQRMVAVRERYEANNKQLHRYRQILEAPFDKRSVSSVRRNKYIDLTVGRIDMTDFLRSDDEVVRIASLFERRLRLLAENWEHWQWTGPDMLNFDDPALNKAYDDLIDEGKAAPAK